VAGQIKVTALSTHSSVESLSVPIVFEEEKRVTQCQRRDRASGKAAQSHQQEKSKWKTKQKEAKAFISLAYLSLLHLSVEKG
jgi:hypothetical protein